VHFGTQQPRDIASLVSGARRQSIVHEELAAIGVGNDLHLIGWQMNLFEAFRREVIGLQNELGGDPNQLILFEF
jgi:hypothetical protein